MLIATKGLGMLVMKSYVLSFLSQRVYDFCVLESFSYTTVMQSILHCSELLQDEKISPRTDRLLKSNILEAWGAFHGSSFQ